MMRATTPPAHLAHAHLAHAHLAKRERALLLVPAVIGGAVGLFLLLTPGNRFVGAEGVAAATALSLGLISGEWTAARLPVVGAFAMSAAMLGACLAAANAGGSAVVRAYLAACAALAGAAASGLLLLLRRGAPRASPDVARWIVALVGLRTAAAIALGAAPLLAPAQVVRAFGIPRADLVFYRVGGAALIGFAIMGVGELRSRCWRELRLPAAMVLVLASLCAVVCLGSLVIGERTPFGYLVAVLGSAVTAATVVELRRGGACVAETVRGP